MPHRRLRHPRRDARLAEKRREGVPEAVDAGRPAAIVALLDPGEAQVAIEDLHEVLRDSEQAIGPLPASVRDPRREFVIRQYG